MLQYQNSDDYKAMLRGLSTQDIMTLAEVIHLADATYRPMIDAEVERRIANWEICEV